MLRPGKPDKTKWAIEKNCDTFFVPAEYEL